MDMLLVDVNSTLMQAIISARRLPSFGSRLAAGSMYSISGFDVARCAQNFRLTNSSIMIRFNDSMSFEKLADPVSVLPEEGFRFRNQTELIGLANTNTQLPNIISELIRVKSTVTDTADAKNRVMATVKMDNGETVIFSLFDSQPVSFHNKLEVMNRDPKVIVATSIKMVGGRLFLNATSGMHVYFDKETKVGEASFYRLIARDTGLAPAALLLKGYAKVESVTIAELNDFIVTGSSQDISFFCTRKVGRVDVDKGWCYVACFKCSEKLQRTISAFKFVRCNNFHVVGSLRYHVEMSIADDTAEGKFVCFDVVLTKLYGLKASDAGQMLAEEGVNIEESKVPPFILDMEGKIFIFQVRVTAYNFGEHHQTFTISRILKEHERVPVPEFVNNGGDADDEDGLGKDKTVSVQAEAGQVSGEAADDAHENDDNSVPVFAKKARVA